MLASVAIIACEPPPEEVPVEQPPPLASPYEVTPATCDAGLVPIDGVGTCTLTVTNISDVEVNVTGATNGPPFIAVGAVGPLSPGDSLVVTVSALPRVAGIVGGELALGPGRLVVPLVVEGIAPEVPELTIAVSPDDIVAGDSVSLDTGILPGAGFTFSWTLLTRPAGSATSLNSTTEPVVAFVADLAGSYTIELAFTDSEGSPGNVVVGVEARAPRDLTLTTTGGVLHFRPIDEELCGPLDCRANDCLIVLGNGPRQSPTAVGGGILVADLPVGTFRVAVTLDEGAAAVSPTLSAFVQGALANEATFALEAGDAYEAFDIVVANDGAVTIEDVDQTVVDGTCI